MKKAALAVLAATLMCGTAHATDFTFTLADGLTGGGVLTGTQDSAGIYLLTGITGQVDNQTITGLAPIGSYGGNDNYLLPNATPQLDFNGFSFNVGAVQYNIYYGTQNSGLPGYRFSNTGNAAYDVSFNATAVGADAAVPEPASWAMMIAGFGVVGAAMRRRKVAFALV